MSINLRSYARRLVLPAALLCLGMSPVSAADPAAKAPPAVHPANLTAEEQAQADREKARRTRDAVATPAAATSTTAYRGVFTAALVQEEQPPTLPRTIVEGSTPTPAAPPRQAQPGANLNQQPIWSPFNSDYAIGAPGAGATGSKTDVPLHETPISVQVIPRQVIVDQNAQRLEDIYLNASGVVQSGNTLNAQSEVRPFIRGFETQFLFRNGLRATAVGAIDPVNIERVEVLKGPSSILYGAIQPGGILNYITKKPMPGDYYKVVQQYGSFDRLRTTVDYNGAVNEDETVLFRVNGAYTASNSFRDFIDLEQEAIAPSLSFVPDEDTNLTFDFSWNKQKTPYDTGVPWGFFNGPLVPINTFVGDPRLDGRDIEDFFYAATLNHAFSDDLLWRTHFLAHQTNAKNEAIRSRGFGPPSPNNNSFLVRYQHEDVTTEGFQFVSDVVVKFGPDNFANTFVTGIDLLHEASSFGRFRSNIAAPVPITNTIVNTNPALRLQPNNFQQNGNTYWAAWYIQDQIDIADDWHFLMGGRLDYVENGQVTYNPLTPNVAAAVPPTQFDTRFTGRLGLLYDLTDEYAPYASVAQSFFPQLPGTLDQFGNPLNPETGIQYEGGLKYQSENGRLVWTTCGYYISKDDVAVGDPSGTFSFPGISQRSQGFEFDIAGQLTDNWQIIANYAYTDAKTTKDPTNPNNIGRQLGNVPFSVARAWLAYRSPQGGFLEGFGFGGGPRYSDSFPVAFNPTTGDPAGVQARELPSYTYWDAGIWYRQPYGNGPSWQYQLNAYNIFDKQYYVRGSTRDIVHPGAPATVIASIGVEY